MAVKVNSARQDYYKSHPEALKGQPKRTVADYVEKNGILVPKRFDSLVAARRSGLPIIVRSEHEQDYGGSSGLLSSPQLERFPEVRTEAELKAILSDKEDKRSHLGYFLVDLHCRLLGIDNDKFRQQISYSFWHLMGGFNRKVVADSSIEGRYHITTSGDHTASYITLEGNKITNFTPELSEELKGGLKQLVELYERIRTLGRFDSNNCPIIEFQTVDGKDYFLQYHRGRQFEGTGFVLDRELKPGEISALFVRGATLEEGITCDVTWRYPWEWGSRFHTSAFALPSHEDGSFDNHYRIEFTEIMLRRRKLQLIGTRQGNHVLLTDYAVGHDNFSRLVKPGVSALVKIDGLLSDHESETLNRQAWEGDTASTVTVHVVSDGKLAYLKRV